MYKIAICEDDKNYIDFLKRIILKINAVDRKSLLFYDFCSGEQLFLYSKWDFDLVIIDMQMNKMDGYEIAMKLREVDRNFILVFCSGVTGPNIRSFKASPFRYLLKSLSNKEMISEMTEILNEMKIKKNYPYVLCKYSSYRDQIRVYPESILYIAIRRDGCEIFACGKLKEKYPKEVLKVNMNLNSIHKIFDENCGFVRIHNSYIVNMAYIVFVNPQKVGLIDGTELNVSRARSKDFQKVFARFMAAKYKEWSIGGASDMTKC